MNNSRVGKKYAVVGDPVAHSLSPLIHTGWIADAGLNASYTRVHLQSETAAEDLRAMVGEYDGLNVTLPHKLSALNAATNSSLEARTVGAANTLVREDLAWTAYNTDVAGFEAAMHAACGDELRNLRVLLIGAGGAARAAVVSLNRAHAKLTIANRSAANAAALANELAPHADTTDLGQIESLSEWADVIVNSASLGHAGASLPPLAPGRGRAFLDLSYGKAAAGALAAASSAGWAPHDGLTMLVAQAAAAFHLWFNIWPDQAKALHACREAVAART
ncbi:MAG: shikimate dehydrogenase [Hyphomonadaceae bacterium]